MTEKQRDARVTKAAQRLLNLFGPKGEHWVRGSSAINADGDIVEVKSRKARKWCLSGAIEKLRIPAQTMQDLQSRLSVTVGGIVEFNDSHKTYTHVRRFLEKIVNRASKK